MTERSIVHAWEACVPQGTRGSNPLPSVNFFLLILILFVLLIRLTADVADIADRIRDLNPGI